MVFKDFVHLWSHKSWMQVNRGQNPNPTSVQCPHHEVSSPPTEYLGFMLFHQKSSQTSAASELFGHRANEGNFPYRCVHIYLYTHIYYEISLAIKGNFSKSQFPDTCVFTMSGCALPSPSAFSTSSKLNCSVAALQGLSSKVLKYF